jgi:hypothetical protein
MREVRRKETWRREALWVSRRESREMKENGHGGLRGSLKGVKEV